MIEPSIAGRREMAGNMLRAWTAAVMWCLVIGSWRQFPSTCCAKPDDVLNFEGHTKQGIDLDLWIGDALCYINDYMTSSAKASLNTYRFESARSVKSFVTNGTKLGTSPTRELLVYRWIPYVLYSWSCHRPRWIQLNGIPDLKHVHLWTLYYIGGTWTLAFEKLYDALQRHAQWPLGESQMSFYNLCICTALLWVGTGIQFEITLANRNQA